MTLKVLIVDDHTNARLKIGRLLEGYDWVEVVGEAANGLEAIEQYVEHRPDLLFLDIQMPGLNGFEVVEKLQQMDHFPKVVFVTAFDEFALKAFDVNAVDYLLKPVKKDRFAAAMGKLEAKLEPTPSTVVEYYRKHRKTKPQLLIKMGNSVDLVPWSDVQLITATEDFSEVWTTTNSHLTDLSLDKLEQEAPDEEYFRVERATICRMSLIDKVVTDGKGHYHVEYRLEAFPTLKISRRRYGALKKALKAFS